MTQVWHTELEIYETAHRAFAEGDRVQLTRAWDVGCRKRLANRSSGTIRKLDGSGKGQIEIDGKVYGINLERMRHLDYAYARTSYSLQYSSNKQILVHVDTGYSRARVLTDQSYLYVAVSRGAERAMVFTDDRETLLSHYSPVLHQRISAGTQELWVVDSKRETVTVINREGVSVIYGRQDRIPLVLFGGDLAVSEIFGQGE
jgi:hypothetical protein